MTKTDKSFGRIFFSRAIMLTMAIVMVLAVLSFGPTPSMAADGVPGLKDKTHGDVVTIDGIEWKVVKSQFMTASQKTVYMLILNDVISPSSGGVVYATSIPEFNGGNFFNNRVQQQIDGWYAALNSPTLKKWAIKPNYYGTWLDNSNTLNMAGNQTSRVAMLPLKEDVYPSISTAQLSLLTPQNPASNMKQWWTDTTTTNSGAIGYKEVLLSNGTWGIKYFGSGDVYARPIIWVLGDKEPPTADPNIIYEDSTGLLLLGKSPGSVVVIDGIQWRLVKSQYMTASMRTAYLLILNDVIYPSSSGVVYAVSIPEFNGGNFFNNRVQQQIDGWYAALNSPMLKRWALQPNYYGTWLDNTNTLKMAGNQTSRVAMLPLKADVFPALSTAHLSLLTPQNPASNMKQWWTNTTTTSNGAIGYKEVLLSNGTWGIKGYNSKDVYARPEIWVLGSGSAAPVTATINVVHKDIDGVTILNQNSFKVNAGTYGPYYPETFAGYNSDGVLASDSAPAYGTISGGQTITITYLYTKQQQSYPVYVFYYQDSTAGKILGIDILTVTAPLGSPITGVDTTKYAPVGYDVPGTISGDTTLKLPYSIVNVVYTQNAPTQRQITVRHFLQQAPNSTVYVEETRSFLTAGDGDVLNSSSAALNFPGYTFYSASPVTLTVSENNTMIGLRYNTLKVD